MRPSSWRQFDVFVRHLLPLSSLLLLELMVVVPTHLQGFRVIGPMLVLIGVYYWAVHRPDLLGSGSVFIIGLFSDLLSMTPLGVGSLVLLLVHGLVVSQRKFFRNKNFWVLWWAFLVAAGGGVLVQNLAMTAIYGRVFNYKEIVLCYLMTLAWYPLVAWLLSRLQFYVLHDV